MNKMIYLQRVVSILIYKNTKKKKSILYFTKRNMLHELDMVTNVHLRNSEFPLELFSERKLY